MYTGSLFEHHLSGGHVLFYGDEGISLNYGNFLSLQAEWAWEENTERSNNSGSHVGGNEDECLWNVTPCGLLDMADISGGESLPLHG